MTAISRVAIKVGNALLKKARVTSMKIDIGLAKTYKRKLDIAIIKGKSSSVIESLRADVVSSLTNAKLARSYLNKMA